MDDGEKAQMLARLCGDLRPAAESALVEPLMNAGATHEAALKACEDIAAAIGIAKLQIDYTEENPFDEVGRIKETLNILNDQLLHISLNALGLIQDHLSQWDALLQRAARYGMLKYIEGLMFDRNWETFRGFHDALPSILEALPDRPPRQGGRDARVHWALDIALRAWREATESLPAATKTPEGESTAHLLLFFQTQLGTNGLSAETFRRAIAKLRGA